MVRVKKGNTNIGLTFDDKQENFTINLDKRRRRMGKLNKNLSVGKTQTITVNGRRVTFKRIKKTGFPQWKIIKNK